MGTTIHGFILRSKDRQRLQRFYGALGLGFTEHAHGGPRHAECTNSTEHFVLEVYAASERYAQDALMLRVESVASAVDGALAAGGTMLQNVTVRGTFKFAYVADPDGRPVMLIESNT